MDGSARPAARLLADVLSRWPTAPVSAFGGTGRWVTFERPGGGTVYLQRHAWDDASVPHYLVVLPAGEDRAEQRRCLTLDEAVDTVKRMLVARPFAGGSGRWSTVRERLAGPGRPPVAAAMPA